MNLPAVRDRRFVRRFAIAFAASLFIHEIVAGLWPSRRKAPAEETVITRVVTVVVRTPSPKRVPTPEPTPTITPAPTYTLAPQIAVRAPAPRAAATPAKTLGGAAAVKHAARVVHTPKRSAPPVSLAEGTHSGRQNGGVGTGAGPGSGTGGLAGTGTGSGATGNGNGGDTNSAPCGEITLLPGDTTYRKDGAAIQEVIARIVLSDGKIETGKFPYAFVYPAEAQNPFFHPVGLAKNGGIAVQMPPAGTKLAALPLSVAVVLKHTDPLTGATNLPECAAEPAPTPTPTPT
jgi:hypothetical protein